MYDESWFVEAEIPMTQRQLVATQKGKDVAQIRAAEAKLIGKMFGEVQVHNQVKINQLRPEIVRDVLDEFSFNQDKIRRLEAKVRGMTATGVDTWSVEQRARFVGAFSHPEMKDVETLKEKLKKSHPMIQKLSLGAIHQIAKDLIIGNDSKDPAIPSLCDEVNGNGGKFFRLSKALSHTRQLTLADLKKYPFKM